jgi:purine-nucleoside phosphorylase
MLAHLKCAPDDVAPYVLLPGDPDRATRIAGRHLDDARLITDHRRMYGYTGTWKGVPVTVQTSGMGCPSAAIVVEELCRLGARAILRVGSCGALQPGIGLGDLVLGTAATSLNGTTERLVGMVGYAPAADFELTRLTSTAAEVAGQRLHVGPVGTCDIFYETDEVLFDRLRRFGLLALEMEASALFTLGARERVRAGCLLLVSDIIKTGERISAGQKHAAVDRMTVVALEALRRLAEAG